MPRQNVYKKVQTARKVRNKKWRRAALIIGILYLLIVDIFGDMGLIKYGRMDSHKTVLIADIAKLKKDNAKLTREVHALKNSSDYMEILARNKLGLARPGEIVCYNDAAE